MKRYFLILTALLFFVGIVGLPPSFYDASWLSSQRQVIPERREYMALREELGMENWRFQRTQWRDSVSRALLELDPETEPYLVALPSWTSDSLKATVDRGIALHLRAIDAERPKLPVGVFLIPQDAGSHPTSLTGAPPFTSGLEFYVARGGESPFCALVDPVDRGDGYHGVKRTLTRLVYAPQSDPSVANTLRICGFFARYGNPGPEVQTWLREGAAFFGSGINKARRSLVYLGYGSPRGPFGMMNRYSSLSARGIACLAGVKSACEVVLKTGGRRESPYFARGWSGLEYGIESPVDFFGRDYAFDTDLGEMGPYLFQSLEEEFGPSRFEAFWTSELPVLEAFQTAFGVSADEWVMKWARGLFGSTDRGPGVPLNATLLSLLTLGLFGCGALFMGRRKG